MDFLWKKESAKADALYVDLFKNIAPYSEKYKEMTTYSKNALSAPTKTNSISEDLRKRETNYLNHKIGF